MRHELLPYYCFGMTGSRNLIPVDWRVALWEITAACIWRISLIHETYLARHDGSS